MHTKTYYRTGENHPNWKTERNNNLIKDRYPNFPATGTTRLKIAEIQEKYFNEDGQPLSRSRIFAIIKRMKEIQFNK